MHHNDFGIFKKTTHKINRISVGIVHKHRGLQAMFQKCHNVGEYQNAKKYSCDIYDGSTVSMNSLAMYTSPKGLESLSLSPLSQLA